MKFQGDIASIPVTDVAQNLSANRKAGTLTILRGEEVRRIAFQEGKIVSYSDNLGFSVPGWLEEKRLVEPDVLKRAVAKAHKSRKKHLGEYLEGAGALGLDDYLSHLKGLVLEVLYETFTFRDGTFEFQEDEFDQRHLDPEILGAKFELPVGPILIESARRLDDWEALRKSLPSESDIYRITPSEKKGCLKELEGDEVAQAAVKLLDGTRCIREVIALIPASRFEAQKAIADLVTRKKARPIDGSELMGQLGSCRTSAEKSRALTQLKAALEREPGNRILLKKVADLSQAVGNLEESAVFRKLLAPALIEDGDRDGAEKELRQSLKLNPKDIGAWQKLYDLLAEKGEEEPLRAFGSEMARNLRKIGLEELARDHLARMVERFPAVLDLRLEHAECLYALGDRTGAAEALLNLTRELLKKGQVDDAERALAKVLEFDRDHKRAREIYEKIRSGKLARQRARRRQLLRGTLASLLLAALGFFIGYDLFVRREFALATREVFAEGLIEKGKYVEAAERLNEVRERHRWSLVRFLEGKEMPEALREMARRKGALPSSASGPSASGPSASPTVAPPAPAPAPAGASPPGTAPPSRAAAAPPSASSKSKEAEASGMAAKKSLK